MHPFQHHYQDHASRYFTGSLREIVNGIVVSSILAVSGQVGDKSSRRHPSRRQVESATSNSATTAVNSATTAVKSATNALVKSATMIENGNNESLKLRYYYHDGPNTFVFSFYFHTCQPREKFRRDKRGVTERSERTSEGGSGGPPPENFKNLHCKWCNLRYS